MKFTRFTTAAVLLLATAGIAHAERNPNPKPSGKVIHLFGPNGVLSDLPGLPSEESSHPAQTQSNGSIANGAIETHDANTGNSMETSDNPSWHDIFHQMFVVGDPNAPNKPAGGRPSERPNAPTSN